MLPGLPGYLLVVIFSLLPFVSGFRSRSRHFAVPSQIRNSYLDELNIFKSEKKVLVGFTTDSWNVGLGRYKGFLAVNKMVKKIQAAQVACVEIPMWEAAQVHCRLRFALHRSQPLVSLVLHHFNEHEHETETRF